MAELTEQQSNDPSSTEPQPQTELQPAVQHPKSQQTVQQPVAPQPTQYQPKQRRWPSWTGFSGKTAWDWLQFFSALLIPIVVLFATLAFNNQQDRANKAQHDNDLKIAQGNRVNDLKIADDQQQEATLKTYLDDMTTLLLDKKLGSKVVADKVASNEAAIVARAKTLTALRRLTDPRRKATVVQFLYEAHLIGYYIEGDIISLPVIPVDSIIDLSGADLHSVDLNGAILSGANLSGADLTGAFLIKADLFYTYLNGAKLSGADLSGADLTGANLHSVDLSYAKLSGAFLGSADLSYAKLSGADLSGADLSGANLDNAQGIKGQLALTKSLKGAIMPDGSIHP